VRNTYKKVECVYSFVPPSSEELSARIKNGASALLEGLIPEGGFKGSDGC